MALDVFLNNLVNSLYTTLGPTPGIGLTGTAVLTKIRRKYDPLGGHGVALTPQKWTVPITPPEPFAAALINGTSIKAGDIKTMIPAMRATPANSPELAYIKPDVTMTLTINDKEYKILEVETIEASNTPISFILHCRA